MLANNNSIHTLFERIVKQYEILKKKNVFLFNFKKEAMFQDNFDEFDDSKEVVENLISEYKATENANYLQNLDESQN